MSVAEILIQFSSRADEGSIRDAAVQKDFRDAWDAIRVARLPVEAQSYSEKSEDGAAWLVGEFIVPLMAASSAIWVFIGTWPQANNGRKVRLTVGDVEVEDASIQEGERLLEIVKSQSPN